MRDFEWCACPGCSHRLMMFRFMNAEDNLRISIKCPSCKKIVEVSVVDGTVLTGMIAGKNEPVFVFGKEVDGANAD